MTEHKDAEFHRALGPWSTSALVSGCMIGTGIFFFVSDVAVRLPSVPAILAAWIVGTAIASCGALSLAELAGAYPETGGIYVYLRRAYGPFVGFIYCWAEFLIMRPGSLGIMVVAFARYFAQFVGLDIEASPWLGKCVALGVIVAVTAVNILGVRAGGRVQNVLTAIKILCLLAIIFVGAVFAAGLLEPQPVEIEPHAFEAELSEHSGGALLLLFGAALIPVMWTIGGWDESPFVAEEVRNPERNLPISILGGLWTAALLFILVNAAYLAILSPGEIAGSFGVTATVAMQRALGDGAGKAIALAVMVCTFGAANGLTMTGGRIAYAAGRSQALFRWFAHTNPKTKTPVRSLMVQAALTGMAVWFLENPFQLLLYTGLAYWLFGGLMAASVIVLRFRDPDRQRPFRVWGYPIVPLLFVAAAVAMAVSVIMTDIRDGNQNSLITLGILAVGAAFFGLQTLVFRGKS